MNKKLALTINFPLVRDNFLKELTIAAAGKKSSLSFIIHEIPSTSSIPDGETFQVLAMGGTVFLNALLKKQKSRYLVIRRESKTTDVFKTKKMFLSFIEREIDPAVRFVAINFAYPLVPVFERGRLDGILVRGSKEHEFEGLIGEKVGESVEKRVRKNSGRKISVSIANDTICLLLSGLTEVRGGNPAAGIIGTGINFALFLDRDHPVNLEAGNFDKFEQSDTGILIDQESVRPGMALLEKEISGAYLYKHFNAILKLNHIDFPELTATKELDAILEDTSSDIYPIASMLLERAAGFTSAAIAAITLFKRADTIFVMEGSLFWSARYFRQNVKKMLLLLVPEYTITFIKIDDSPIFGAARLIG